jgi:hypothetical protein
MSLLGLAPADGRIGNRRGYRLLWFDGLGYYRVRFYLNSGGHGRGSRLGSALYFDIQNRSEGANQNKNCRLKDLHMEFPLLF